MLQDFISGSPALSTTSLFFEEVVVCIDAQKHREGRGGSREGTERRGKEGV